MNSPWYNISNIAEFDTPALVVFPERVQRNINTAIAMAGGPHRLRPHIKTHKSPEATRMLIDAGITKFKCATIAEAEILGMGQAKDVLLAYQPVGPKLSRFVALIKRYPATIFSCLIDNAISANEQSTVFVVNSLTVPVYIDLNVGMGRTGIEPDQAALELYQYCASLQGIKIIGLHAYDGHIRNIDLNARAAECDAAFLPVKAMKHAIINAGLNMPVIIAGGSHTFPIHCKRKEVECSPGTFIYWDKGNSDYCPEQDFDIAAIVMTRVVSLPAAGRICTDLGHKSVAAENVLTNRVYFMNAPELKAISQSEEHLVLDAGNNHSFKEGDILYGVPIHICPTVALYESVLVAINGKITSEWKNLARDRKINV